MVKDSSTRKVHKTSHKKHKGSEPEEASLKDTPVNENAVLPNSPPNAEVPETVASDLKGTYDSVEKSWIWNIESDTRLTVRSFKGRMYIDIRKLWDGKPTKKGISLSPELFKLIQGWNVDEAIRVVTVEK